MSQITVPNRPFATEPLTGFMLPDGFFVTTLGYQAINSHFSNTSNSSILNIRIYLEGASDPNLQFKKRSYQIPQLASGASHLLSWEGDFSNVKPGIHRVSFIIEHSGRRTRVIKKIFVTEVTVDDSDTFHATMPEGELELTVLNFFEPEDVCCDFPSINTDGDAVERPLTHVGEVFEREQRDIGEFIFCPPGYLPRQIQLIYSPETPYEGQYSKFPFQDPLWKFIGGAAFVIGVVGFIIRSNQIKEKPKFKAEAGAKGKWDYPYPDCNPCEVKPYAKGSYSTSDGWLSVWFTLAVLGGGVAAFTDYKDSIRRGQENTIPSDGELTIAEQVNMSIGYPEAIIPGQSYAVDADWEYTRMTTGDSYTYSVTETPNNQHTLSTYTVDAPREIKRYNNEKFEIEAGFYDDRGNPLDDDLFVFCLLLGPNGQILRLPMQDDGISPDREPNDGVYTTELDFRSFTSSMTIGPEAMLETEKLAAEDVTGRWIYYVLAQDINTAKPDMEPEEAAKYSGGMVLTPQLSISVDGGECPVSPDGHVDVI